MELASDGCPAGFRVHVTHNAAFDDWAALAEGAYLLRSNITDWSDEQLWKAMRPTLILGKLCIMKIDGRCHCGYITYDLPLLDLTDLVPPESGSAAHKDAEWPKGKHEYASTETGRATCWPLTAVGIECAPPSATGLSQREKKL